MLNCSEWVIVESAYLTLAAANYGPVNIKCMIFKQRCQVVVTLQCSLLEA